MKKKRPTKKHVLGKQIKCEDCGQTYTAGAPHLMFCSAHTCRQCGDSFSHVLQIYDSRPKAMQDGQPERRCDECLEEQTED